MVVLVFMRVVLVTRCNPAPLHLSHTLNDSEGTFDTISVLGCLLTTGLFHSDTTLGVAVRPRRCTMIRMPIYLSHGTSPRTTSVLFFPHSLILHFPLP